MGGDGHGWGHLSRSRSRSTAPQRWTEYLAPYVFNGDGNTLDTSTLTNGTHTLTVTRYGYFVMHGDRLDPGHDRKRRRRAVAAGEFGVAGCVVRRSRGDVVGVERHLGPTVLRRLRISGRGVARLARNRVSIGGATAASYVVQAAHVGLTLVRVTASNAGVPGAAVTEWADVGRDGGAGLAAGEFGVAGCVGFGAAGADVVGVERHLVEWSHVVCV